MSNKYRCYIHRYTQNQRRKETKLKKYSKIILQYKKECKTKIIELETELSKYNRKTLQIDKFKKYIKKKNQVNNLLFDFYEKYIFRKLKLNSYLNILKSEQKLINRFTKIFGTPNKTIIAIGDFEQKKHRKYKEPANDAEAENDPKLIAKADYKIEIRQTEGSIEDIKASIRPKVRKLIKWIRDA